MQFTTIIPVIFASVFATLVAGDACVVGGPDSRVDAAQKCCFVVSGTWFQNYDAQGICVFTPDKTSKFDGCFVAKVPDYIPTCIACDASVNCGLTV